MRRNGWVAVGAFWMAVAVGLGAFGAHGLKASVPAEDLTIWETGVRYHAWHALALVLWGLFKERTPQLRAVPGWCFLLGSSIFGGTLYGIVLGAPRWLGAITPIGGTLLIVGWITFGLQASKRSR